MAKDYVLKVRKGQLVLTPLCKPRKRRKPLSLGDPGGMLKVNTFKKK